MLACLMLTLFEGQTGESCCSQWTGPSYLNQQARRPLSRLPISQPDLDNFHSKLPSQVILGWGALTFESSHHIIEV